MTVPKLRTGSYFPNWLLERRKLAESVLIAVVADAHLVGVSTRRMDKLVGTLGISSKLVNALVSTIFAQTSRKAIMAQYERVINALRDDFPEIAQMLADAQPDLTAFAAFPRERWTKIRSFQPHRAPQPRDQAPRRRRPGSSPIATPYTPLIGSVLSEQQVAVRRRRYLSQALLRRLTGICSRPTTAAVAPAAAPPCPPPSPPDRKNTTPRDLTPAAPRLPLPQRCNAAALG